MSKKNDPPATVATELLVVPEKLTEIVQTCGLPLSNAQKVVKNYIPFLERIDEIANQLKTLDNQNPEHIEIARKAKIELGKICSETGARKDKDKESIKILDKFIMGIHNTVVGSARLTQAEAQEIAEFKEREAEKQRQLLQTERAALLQPFFSEQIPDVSQMSDEAFKMFLSGAKQIHEEKKEIERQKVLAEETAKVNKEIEDKRFKEIAHLQLFLSENQKLPDLISANVSDEDFLTTIAQLEAVKVKKDKEAEKAKKALDKKDAELTAAKTKADEAQKKLDDKLKQEKDEKDRKEKEEKDAKLAKDKLAKAPIEKQLLAWVEMFSLPETEIQHEKIELIKEKFAAFQKWAKERVSE